MRFRCYVAILAMHTGAGDLNDFLAAFLCGVSIMLRHGGFFVSKVICQGSSVHACQGCLCGEGVPHHVWTGLYTAFFRDVGHNAVQVGNAVGDASFRIQEDKIALVQDLAEVRFDISCFLDAVFQKGGPFLSQSNHALTAWSLRSFAVRPF